MKVFVTGGTGAIGRYAVDALIAAGHEVSALARTPEKAAGLEAKGAAPVTVSLFDAPALAGHFEGHDAIVNLATAIPAPSKSLNTAAWALNNRIRAEGSAAIVAAAMAAGVPKAIQESVSMLYRDGKDAWIDEESPTDRFPIANANHAAEASANRFTAAGGTGIILRFGWFYGPGAAHSEDFLALAKRGICIEMGAPRTYVSSLHVEDGGAAVAAALDLASGTYNVVDDKPLTKRGYGDALAAAAGRKPWIRFPGRLALLLGHHTTALTRSLRVSNKKFREASGWSPAYPSAREGWAAMADTARS